MNKQKKQSGVLKTKINFISRLKTLTVKISDGAHRAQFPYHA